MTHHSRLALLFLVCLFAASLPAKPIAVKLATGINKSSIAYRTKSPGNPIKDVFPGAETSTRLERWVFLDDASDDINSLQANGSIIAIDTLPTRMISRLPTSVSTKTPGTSAGSDNGTMGNTDPYEYLQWQLTRIYAQEAWTVTSGSPDVVVAVVDEGTDITHPDLVNQVAINQAERLGTTGTDDDHNGFIDDVYGWNFVGNNGDPTPATVSEAHGTHVSGIILAAQNGQFGVGVAPHVKLLPVRCGEGGYVSYGYEGIYYATIRGAKIINCSWGGYDASAAEAEAVEYAISHGVTIFAAAGNDARDALFFPSSLPGVISVGATTRQDVPALFSNRGVSVSVWAPGSQIPSTIPANGFAVWDGTSMACPCAVGVGALVASVLPNVTPAELRTILVATGDQMLDVANEPAVRVNAYRAVVEAARRQGTTTAQWSGNEQPGATLQLSIPIQLAQANSEALTLTGTTLTGGTWSTSGSPMTSSQNGTLWTGTLGITLPSDLARGNTIIAGWRATGNNFTRFYGTAIRRVAPPEATLEDNQMRLTFSGIGALGVYDPYSPLPVGVSLQAPPDAPGVLFDGSFLLGSVTNSSAVLDNVYGDNSQTGFDWEVPISQPVTTSGTPTNQMQTIARPYPDRSTLPIEVQWSAQMASQSAGVPAVDILGRIHNTGVSPLDSLIAGWLIDFDIGDPSYDVAFADTSQRLLTMGFANQPGRYAVYVNHGTLAVARTLLTTALYGSAHLEDWNDDRKWQLLTWAGDNGTVSTQGDYAMIFATPAFSLAGNGYYDFGFRIYYTASQQQAVQLATQWRSSSSPFSNGSSTLQPPSIQVQTMGSLLRINTSNTEVQKLHLFNVLGQKVRTVDMNRQTTATISMTGLPHGAYFVSAQTAQGSLPARKVIYLP